MAASNARHLSTGTPTTGDIDAMPGPGLSKLANGKGLTGRDSHPSGKTKNSPRTQIIRGFLFVTYFVSSVVAIFLSQLIGASLYWIDRDRYYSYMAFTKQNFALVTTMMTQLWGPTLIRISGDPDVASQIQRLDDGTVEFNFPERLVLIANHQIYTDWLYLWWVGYANKPRVHGRLYIILKESLRWIPILGQGMMFYGFIFMSRKMAVDQPRLAYRLRKLKTERKNESGKSMLDPMWLLLFPEGTNMSNNGRIKSAQWAKKNDLVDPKHLMLPRSTGIFFCLNELKDTVEWVYDCTMAYEGIPRDGYGEEFFTLSGIYFQGRPPKSVNFYWRRYRIADMPLHDQKEFDAWLRARWEEKDVLMEHYVATGRFPSANFTPEQLSSAAADSEAGFIETEVRTRFPWEFLQAFVVVAATAYVYFVLRRAFMSLPFVS